MIIKNILKEKSTLQEENFLKSISGTKRYYLNRKYINLYFRYLTKKPTKKWLKRSQKKRCCTKLNGLETNMWPFRNCCSLMVIFWLKPIEKNEDFVIVKREKN
jgi:hypothetical protein